MQWCLGGAGVLFVFVCYQNMSSLGTAPAMEQIGNFIKEEIAVQAWENCMPAMLHEGQEEPLSFEEYLLGKLESVFPIYAFSDTVPEYDTQVESDLPGSLWAGNGQDSEEGAVPEVTFVDYSEDIKMENKDWILLSVQENCPVISIPGNEAAAEKMNLVFEQQHASNQTYIEEDKELAQSAYEDLPKEQKAEWTGYGYGATYKVMYCSANILSIACDSYEWQGTPHPNTWTTTYCFDVPTGKLLTLADVFTDKSKAGEIIDQHILDTITAEPYKDYLLEGYEDFVSDILREDVFYLNDKGLAVICNPYMVTAYAGGSIEIEVPYEDLKDVMAPQYIQGE
jgi:hypothetical protein